MTQEEKNDIKTIADLQEELQEVKKLLIEIYEEGESITLFDKVETWYQKQKA